MSEASSDILTIRISEKQKTELSRKCEEEGITMSDLLREITREGLDTPVKGDSGKKVYVKFRLDPALREEVTKRAKEEGKRISEWFVDRIQKGKLAAG